MRSRMQLNSRARRICANIYQCRQAALFLGARPLPPHRDRCGCCAGTTTLFDFAQRGMLLRCPMCTFLSGIQSGAERTESVLADCLGEQGQHCRLCALEYASLRDQSEDWIGNAGKLLQCFLGGPHRDQLAKSLYNLCVSMGCAELRKLIVQTLEMLTEERRIYLEGRILEASKLLDFELLCDTPARARAV
jgi:hypothetical protein